MAATSGVSAPTRPTASAHPGVPSGSSRPGSTVSRNAASDLRPVDLGRILARGRRENVEDVRERLPSSRGQLLVRYSSLSDPDQQLWCAALAGQASDDLSAGGEFGHVGKGACRQTGGGALEEYGRKSLAAAQHVKPRVFVMSGQNHDLGAVELATVVALVTLNRGESSRDVDPVRNCT